MKCLLVVAVLIVFVFVVPVLADDGQPPAGEVPSLRAWVVMIAAGGAGVIISFLFERCAWFRALKGEQRWWVIFGLSVGLPFVARIALEYVPPDVWNFLEPYWQAVALGFVGFIGSQLAHVGVNQRLGAMN